MNNIVTDKLTTFIGSLLAGLTAIQAVPDVTYPDWANIGLAGLIAALGALTRR